MKNLGGKAAARNGRISESVSLACKEKELLAKKVPNLDTKISIPLRAMRANRTGLM